MRWRKSGACFTWPSLAHATSFILPIRICASPEATATCSNGHHVFCRKSQTIWWKTGKCRENDEARMTNDEGTPNEKNDEESRQTFSSFRFRHYFELRHSLFVILFMNLSPEK